MGEGHTGTQDCVVLVAYSNGESGHIETHFLVVGSAQVSTAHRETQNLVKLQAYSARE